MIPSFEEAIHGADVVCCCTDTGDPITRYEWFDPGTHVTSVGGTFGPELDAETIRRARVFVEWRGAAAEPAARGGPRAPGTIDPAAVTEVGEVIAGLKPGRETADEITVYKSTGSGFEDAVVARIVYQAAVAAGVGTEGRTVTAIAGVDAARGARGGTAACAAHPPHPVDPDSGGRVPEARIAAADRELQGSRLLRSRPSRGSRTQSRAGCSRSVPATPRWRARTSPRSLGVPCRVMMYDTAPALKLDGVRALGATPVLCRASACSNGSRRARGNTIPRCSSIRSPNEAVITGHSSIVPEILADLPDVERVFVPVGGGGLICGIALGFAALKPEVARHRRAVGRISVVAAGVRGQRPARPHAANDRRRDLGALRSGDVRTPWRRS